MNSDIPLPREEAEILQELENLCKSPGYAHALAYLSFLSNCIKSDKFYNDEKFIEHHWESLLRPEVELLTGLMIKAKLQDALKRISPSKIEEYVQKTTELLEELHERLNYNMYSELFAENVLKNKDEYKKILADKGLRESFFYSAETAYDFQYKDFAIKKHTINNDWLEREKGFNVNEMGKTIEAVSELIILQIEMAAIGNMMSRGDEHEESILKFLGSNDTADLPDIENVKSNWLMSFIIDKQKIISSTQLSDKVVSNVLNAFSIPNIPCNENFKMHGDDNELAAFPIIKIDDNSYLSFQPIYLLRNFYQSPDFWMRKDDSYVNESEKNRGAFLEEACAECMTRVFQGKNIYKNVLILDNKGQTAGEIDVLVCYADKVIIIEAKSKAMTSEAIKGSTNKIKKDFDKGINKSYEQAFKCGELLLNENYKLTNKNDEILDIRRDFTDIFLMCITAHTYPGLPYQIFSLFSPKEHDIIRYPYITDIFVLDVLCEFLNSPLYFFSYHDKKSRYFNDIIPSNELSILGYHLAENLFIKPDEMMHFDDSFTMKIDRSFKARRENYLEECVPEGILTKYKGKFIDKIIQQLAITEANYIINFSNLLLDLSENAMNNFSDQCEEIIRKAKEDKIIHDFTTVFDDIGITVHASFDSDIEVYKQLASHCKIRKYKQKANKWYGIALNVENENAPIRNFVASHAKWQRSETMEEIISMLPFKEDVKI